MGRFIQILVVDDDRQLRRTLRAALLSQGYEVRVAEDGQSALEEMKNWTPNVVITDPGPASAPLSFLDSPEYKAGGGTKLYDLPNMRPATLLNEKLPKWLSFGWEERVTTTVASN